MASTQTNQPVIESGTIFLRANETELLQVDFQNKVINVDIENKKFLKGLIGIGRNFTKKQQAKKQKPERETKKSPSPLTIARTLAETLKKNGITLRVSYEGGVVATLGAEAHPTLLQLVTKTKAIALNGPLRAIKMIV